MPHLLKGNRFYLSLDEAYAYGIEAIQQEYPRNPSFGSRDLKEELEFIVHSAFSGVYYCNRQARYTVDDAGYLAEMAMQRYQDKLKQYSDVGLHEFEDTYKDHFTELQNKLDHNRYPSSKGYLFLRQYFYHTARQMISVGIFDTLSDIEIDVSRVNNSDRSYALNGIIHYNHYCFTVYGYSG